MLGQQLGGRLADVANSQRGEQPRQRGVFAALQGVEKILRRLLGHAIEARPVALCVKAVEIGDVVHQTAVDQLLDEFFAQSFDIHGAARAEEI